MVHAASHSLKHTHSPSSDNYEVGINKTITERFFFSPAPLIRWLLLFIINDFNLFITIFSPTCLRLPFSGGRTKQSARGIIENGGGSYKDEPVQGTLRLIAHCLWSILVSPTQHRKGSGQRAELGQPPCFSSATSSLPGLRQGFGLGQLFAVSAVEFVCELACGAGGTGSPSSGGSGETARALLSSSMALTEGGGGGRGGSLKRREETKYKTNIITATF